MNEGNAETVLPKTETSEDISNQNTNQIR